jgi:hypothetical protein
MNKWTCFAIRASLDGQVKKQKLFSPTSDADVRNTDDVHQAIAMLGEDG